MLAVLSFDRTGGGGFNGDMIQAHNVYRAKHGSPPLKWSVEAAKKAQSWAERLASTGTLQHGNHDHMGQNIAYKSGSEYKGQEVVDNWYSEEKTYNYSTPGFHGNSGHFTQLVWKSTTHIGVGRAVIGSKTYVVANYTPAGNITNTGQFEANVLKPK